MEAKQGSKRRTKTRRKTLGVCTKKGKNRGVRNNEFANPNGKREACEKIKPIRIRKEKAPAIYAERGTVEAEEGGGRR